MDQRHRHRKGHGDRVVTLVTDPHIARRITLIAAALHPPLWAGRIALPLRVLPPFLTACLCRVYAAIFSFCAGVMPPMPMLGRSLLYVHSHCVA